MSIPSAIPWTSGMTWLMVVVVDASARAWHVVALLAAVGRNISVRRTRAPAACAALIRLLAVADCQTCRPESLTSEPSVLTWMPKYATSDRSPKFHVRKPTFASSRLVALAKPMTSRLSTGLAGAAEPAVAARVFGRRGITLPRGCCGPTLAAATWSDTCEVIHGFVTSWPPVGGAGFASPDALAVPGSRRARVTARATGRRRSRKRGIFAITPMRCRTGCVGCGQARRRPGAGGHPTWLGGGTSMATPVLKATIV